VKDTEILHPFREAVKLILQNSLCLTREEVLLESLLEGMDEFYSINLAREAIKGMAENARNGWYNGGFPG
jgi:hypothetical protein